MGTFGVGYLGYLYYGMGLRDGALTIVFFNLLSVAPVAWFCTFGKELGLRQMVISRFVLGYWTGKIPVIFNLITCCGCASTSLHREWLLTAMNTIGGVSCLRAVSTTHPIPTVTGVVLLSQYPAGLCVLTLQPYSRSSCRSVPTGSSTCMKSMPDTLS